MPYLTHLTKGPVRILALMSMVLVAPAISLRADTTCIADCGQGASRLSGISGTEDIEAGPSGFDVYFKPGLPIYVIAPSDLLNTLNSHSSDDSPFSGGGWADAGSLQFSEGASKGSKDDPPGTSDDPAASVLSQIFNAPAPGVHFDPPSPFVPAPTPAPEPHYSALAMLGLGWAGLAVGRIMRSRRQY